MFDLSPGRAAVAGFVATAVMTMLMLAAPLMGMPSMPIGAMLGQFLGIGTAAGWGMHAMIGLVLAGIYGAFLAGRLPGPPALRGAIYGVVVFLVAQIVVTPMMGGGIFSGGNMAMIGGSLIGHLVYGGVVGAIFGTVPRPQQSLASRAWDLGPFAQWHVTRLASPRDRRYNVGVTGLTVRGNSKEGA